MYGRGRMPMGGMMGGPQGMPGDRGGMRGGMGQVDQWEPMGHPGMRGPQDMVQPGGFNPWQQFPGGPGGWAGGGPEGMVGPGALPNLPPRFQGGPPIGGWGGHRGGGFGAGMPGMGMGGGMGRGRGMPAGPPIPRRLPMRQYR